METASLAVHIPSTRDAIPLKHKLLGSLQVIFFIRKMFVIFLFQEACLIYASKMAMKC